ncbi:MAG: hypothetical protein HN742_24295 [Lentisphaerae bacterium]|nr:hypothetical protein [Lentisphaerota bacterium]MBT4818108.1 hypothetical protein [Lentisphaerota bacterium]MBT5608961.1 hypothetical protein [Lentisphaerota bacterium]MBT7061500.1 hypothetical protein [Lentisphaerota bacterium]MBT7845020.1 hypothetical protein [Lentisphaerota bacterium]
MTKDGLLKTAVSLEWVGVARIRHPIIATFLAVLMTACHPNEPKRRSPGSTGIILREIKALCRRHNSRDEFLRDSFRALNPLTDVTDLMARRREHYDPQLRRILRRHHACPDHLGAILDDLCRQSIVDTRPPLGTTVPANILVTMWLVEAWDAYHRAILAFVAEQRSVLPVLSRRQHGARPPARVGAALIMDRFLQTSPPVGRKSANAPA